MKKNLLFNLTIIFILLFAVDVRAESKICEYKDETVNVKLVIENDNISNREFYEYSYENKDNYIVQELVNKSIINIDDFKEGCPSTIYYTKEDKCIKNSNGKCELYNRDYIFYSKSNNQDNIKSLTFVEPTGNSNNNSGVNVNTNFFGSLDVVKCGNAEIPSSVPSIIRTIIIVIKIAVPLVLIIMGMVDMLKAVIASDEKKLASSQKQFFKRLGFGAAVFLVITVIQFLIGIIASDDASIINCVSCMLGDESTCIAINKPVSPPPPATDKDPNGSEEFVTSSPDITFSYKYVPGNGHMPYGLFTPSTANDGKDIPLIVWLHGGGSTSLDEESFKKLDLMGILNNWKLDGFNAYVLCPKLTNEWSDGLWITEKSKDNLYSLIDKFIEENNINTDKIILAGFSQGARGVLYVPYFRPNFFSSLVVLSAFDLKIDISSLKHIPARGYSEGFETMSKTFVNTFGKESYTEIKTEHDNLPNLVFNRDENKDNKSDVIEWMLTQSSDNDKNNSGQNSGSNSGQSSSSSGQGSSSGSSGQNNKPITSTPNKFLTKNEYRNGEPMPYILYTPPKKNSNVPLIIWLHGKGEIGSFNGLSHSGLPKVLDEWNLSAFNAYVLCPLLKSSRWIDQKNDVDSLVKKIIKENNINTNKIILVGHSLGGYGVFDVANKNANFYSAFVVLSGYNPGNIYSLDQFKKIPTRGYYGPGDSAFMKSDFKDLFGYSKDVNVAHGAVPKAAFNLDENNDGKSDLIEWMLKQ